MFDLAHTAVTIVACGVTAVFTAALVSTYLSPVRIRRRAEDAADETYLAEYRQRRQVVAEVMPVEPEHMFTEDNLRTAMSMGVFIGQVTRTLAHAAYEPRELHGGRHRAVEARTVPADSSLEEMLEAAS